MLILIGLSMAKALNLYMLDSDSRKLGDQIGLDTLVVLTVILNLNILDSESRKFGDQMGSDTLVVLTINDANMFFRAGLCWKGLTCPFCHICAKR